MSEPVRTIAGPGALPLLPLRDIVVFPHMVVPLFVGREKSIAAIERAMAADKQILLATQRRSSVDDPLPADLYDVGVRAEILQVLKLPDNTVKILVEGLERVRLVGVGLEENHLSARAEPIEPGPEPGGRETEALRRSVNEQFEKYVKLSRKIPPELLVTVAGIAEPDKLADTVSANLMVKNQDKQALLETTGTSERLEQLLLILSSEIEIMLVERKIHSKVKKQMEKTQKEYYLVEQMKAIQKELGKKDEFKSEIDELRARVKAAKMSPEATEKATRELKKIEMMPPMSAEATVVRNYLDWLVSLPWSVSTTDLLDVDAAAKILDEDHTGLEKVKERILEYLAVTQLVKKIRGPDPLPGRAAGRRQDLAGPLDRPRDGPQFRAALARRRPRRGRDPRPPPDLHRLAPRADHPVAEKGQEPQPGLPARRGRQARDGLPRRPRERAARGAGPRAEQHLQRPLPRDRLRPLRRHVRDDGELGLHHPAAAAGPDGDHPALGLHRDREGADRPAPPRAQAARGERPDARRT